jgi:hypothetical protein
MDEEKRVPILVGWNGALEYIAQSPKEDNVVIPGETCEGRRVNGPEAAVCEELTDNRPSLPNPVLVHRRLCRNWHPMSTTRRPHTPKPLLRVCI